MRVAGGIATMTDNYFAVVAAAGGYPSGTGNSSWYPMFPSSYTLTERIPTGLEAVTVTPYFSGVLIPAGTGYRNSTNRDLIVHVTAYMSVGATGVGGLHAGKINLGVDEAGTNEVRSVTTSILYQGAATVSHTELLEPGEILVYATYQQAATSISTAKQVRLNGFVLT